MRATRADLEAEERGRAALEQREDLEAELDLEAERIAGHFPGPPMPPNALAYRLAQARIDARCS